MAQNLGHGDGLGGGNRLTVDECNTSKVLKMVGRAW